MIVPTQGVRAQKKEISQARAYIKSGKDYDKAEKLMVDLIKKDSANRQNKQVLVTMYVAIKKQYEQGNEKLYLKEKYDTAAFYQLSKRLFEVGETLDSVDARPMKNGKIDIAYRQRHSTELNLLRPNLFYGGTYYIIKDDFAQAYDFFKAYLDCGKQPLFEKFDYNKQDPRMKEAAYWATYAGYRMNDACRTLTFIDLALKDTAKCAYTMQYQAEAYQWKKNEPKYLESLLAGFEKYPTNEYFFPRLIDYYQDHQQREEALAVAEKALSIDPQKDIFLFAKSTILLNMDRYDECIAVTDTLIRHNDSIPEAYYNIGIAYLNKVLYLEQQRKTETTKTVIRELYEKAKPYMEKYRSMMPESPRSWAMPLYRIYLNLNMGKQFDEIDRILKSN